MNKKIIGALCCIVFILITMCGCLKMGSDNRYNYDSIQTCLSDISNNNLGKNAVKSTSKFLAYIENDSYHIDVLDDVLVNQFCTFDGISINLQQHELKISQGGQINLNNSYVSNGKISVVISSQDEENCSIITSDSTFDNLSFYIFGDTGSGKVFLDKSINYIIGCDFQISGELGNLVLVQTEEDSSLVVSKCNVEADVKSMQKIYVFDLNGEDSILGCNFNLKSDSNNIASRVYCYAIVQRNGRGIVSSCNIRNECYAKYGVAYGIVTGKNSKRIEINDTVVYADSHYIHLNDSYGSIAVGISSNAEETILNNCDVRGVHSGLSINSLHGYILNSKFKSTGHGGIYFARSGRKDDNDVDVPAEYTIEHSEINWCESDGISKVDVNNPDYSGDNKAAFYIGGSAYASNITVYMNDCTVHGNRYSGVLRGTSNERFNTLYIKNTILDSPMRIDNNTLEMYVQDGCNIDLDSEFYWNRNGITTYRNAEDAQVFFD